MIGLGSDKNVFCCSQLFLRWSQQTAFTLEKQARSFSWRQGGRKFSSWFQISTLSHVFHWCEGRWLRRLAEMYTSALEPFEAALYISPSTTSGAFQQACSLERIQLDLFWIRLRYYISDSYFPIVLSFSEMKTFSRPNLQKRRWCQLSCGSENVKKWFWKNQELENIFVSLWWTWQHVFFSKYDRYYCSI